MNEYRYDYETVKGFILSAIFWGVVGLVAGLWISAQLWECKSECRSLFYLWKT